MVEVKLKELMNNVIPAFAVLIRETMPAVAAFKIKKIIKAIDEQAEIFHEQRNELIKRYGAPTESGDISVTPENMQHFMKELDELLELKVEIEATPVSISELGNINVQSMVLMTLDNFIKE